MLVRSVRHENMYPGGFSKEERMTGFGGEADRHGGGSGSRLRFLESVLENASDAVIATGGEPLDEPGPKVVYVNAAFTRMTGYSTEDILGENPRILQGPKTDRAELDRVRESLSKGEPVKAEILNYRKDGSEFWVEMDIVPVFGEGEWPEHWVSVQRDTTERRRAENKLRDTEKALRTLLARHESEMITVLEPDGALRYESPAVERALGYRHDGEAKESLFRHVHPDDAGRLSEALGRALVTPGRTPVVEYRVRRADGEWRWFESGGNNLAEDAGVGGVVVNSRDVTERKEAEEALRDNERRFRSLVGNSSEVVSVVDLDGTLRYASPAMERVFGYEPEAMLGVNVLDFVHPDDLPHVVEETRRAVEDGVGRNVAEYRFRHADGSWRHVESHGTYLTEDPAINGVLVNTRDITPRKEAEEKLRDAEERYRTLVEQIPAVTYIDVFDEESDAGYATTYLAPQIEAMLGYSAEEFIEDPNLWPSLLHPEDREKSLAKDARHYRTGEPQNQEFRMISRDGRVVWVHDEAVILHSEADGIRFSHGFLVDVTERKLAEARLREAEARYRTLVEHVPAVIYIDRSDDVNSAVYMSPQCEGMLGYAPEEWTRDPELWVKTLHPEDRERVLAESERTRRTGEPFTMEYRLMHKDGPVVWVRDEAVERAGEDGEPCWQGVLLDITRRKEAEEKLVKTEAGYRALVEQIPTVTYTQDVEHHGVVTYISPQIENLVGYTPEEWTSDPRLWVSTVHPDDREMVLAEDARTDETGEPFVVEYRKVRKDGRVIWVRSEAKLARDEEGRPLHWQGIVSDITHRKESEERLREAEERYRSLVEQVPGVTYVEDADTGATLYDSPQIEDLLGYPADISQKDPHYWWKIVHPDDLERVLAEQDCGEESGAFSLEYRVFAEDGSVVWLRDEAAVMRDASGEPKFWRGFLFDITERKRAEEALRESEARLASVTSGAPVILFALDGEGRITLSEGKGLESLGAEPGEHIGCSVFEEWRHLPGVLENARRALRGEEVASTVEIGDRAFDARYSPVREENGEVSGVIGVATDITARRKLERELEHRAFHDPLTGLANRSLCADRLSQALKRADRRGASVSLLFMDLDDFKVVNDSLGHDTGDELLIEVAVRLRRCLRPGDTLARLGGDEFVVLLEDTGLEGAIRVANRVSELLEPSFFLGEQEHERTVTASIGITVAALGEASGERRAEDLLREADLAMYRAKEEGKGHYEVFDSEMSARVLGRLEMEDGLRRALDAGEMEVHYQPVVSLENGGIVGVEALVRWRHPERGLVHPGDFIPLAEETGLIIPLGRWVIEASCRQLKAWRAMLPDGESIFLCVNLSARQFRHPGLARDVAGVLEKTGVPPEALYLEVTESVAMAGSRETDSLGELKRLGVGIMIDDFGTGHSSLSYLKKLPVDFIKVDRAFASGLGEDLVDQEIVSAIIRLGHALDLKIVAEGVESAEQLLRLRDLGCDYAQGYFFSEPLPAEEVADLLKTVSLW